MGQRYVAFYKYQEICEKLILLVFKFVTNKIVSFHYSLLSRHIIKKNRVFKISSIYKAYHFVQLYVLKMSFMVNIT